MNMTGRILAAFAALALGAALTVGPEQALAYKRQSTVTGAHGKQATTNVEANRTATGYQRSSTTTGPNNKSVSSQSSGSWDSSTKTWTKDKSVTGPNGQTKSWDKQTPVTK